MALSNTSLFMVIIISLLAVGFIPAGMAGETNPEPPDPNTPYLQALIGESFTFCFTNLMCYENGDCEPFVGYNSVLVKWDGNNWFSSPIVDTGVTNSHGYVCHTLNETDPGIFFYKSYLPGVEDSWSNTCSARILSTPPPTFHITAAKMVRPDILGVACSYSFPEISEGKNPTITCTYVIDGNSYTKSYSMPAGSFEFTDPATSPIKINLTRHSVPRFSDNVHFNVTGNATYDTTVSSPDSTFEGDILLPVVVLHGYVATFDTPWYIRTLIIALKLQNLVPPEGYEIKGYPGGNTAAKSCKPETDKYYPYLRYAFFKMAYQPLTNTLLKQGYELERTGVLATKKKNVYVTLWDSFDDRIGYSSLSYANAVNINQDYKRIAGLVRQHSYADRFNIIAHSTGGLVARYWAENHPNVIKEIITVGTPHDGITRFYEQPFLPKYISRGDYSSKELKIPGGTTQNLIQWFAPEKSAAWTPIDTTRIDPIPSNPAQNPYYKNTFTAGYSAKSNFSILYTRAFRTPYSVTIEWRNSEKTWYNYVKTNFKTGDGYVYWKSASAIISHPSEGSNFHRHEIPNAKQEHGTLLRDPAVNTKIVQILTG